MDDLNLSAQVGQLPADTSALAANGTVIDSEDLVRAAQQVLDVTIAVERASSENGLADFAARSRDVTDAFIRSEAQRGGLVA